MLRQTTLDALTARLPDLERLLDEGYPKAAIAAALHCSQPTLRRFAKAHGVSLSAPRRIPPPPECSTTPDVPTAPFTSAQLKVRTTADFSPEELTAIHARLLRRCSTSQGRRRPSKDAIFVWEGRR